ncbi:MAG: tRNA dihydrouridine synthase DusB [Candidatus Omnitrophica bacterium]|nr:tRNA dihydrouridine synthase DusB [Candidatus Omnitrophota bacterium]MDD5592817.1 tRNA dihydrouridine synthase DusB [Candidatus Omnitrophota bacterium]
MLKIGTLKLNSNLILAPMAGISDLPFRMLNRKFGCELAFVEMINSRSVSYKSKRTQKMLSSNKDDQPLGVQLLGCEIKFVQKAIDVLNKYKFDLLDFNAACPAKKVIRRGEGSGLLKNPKKLSEILKILVKKARVPVTVKIRSGWDKDCVNAKEVASYCQDAGVSALFIHGRTMTQGYSSVVDYCAIGEVKKTLKIPVIASGNILSPQLARKMFEETGCDAIIIARGALGNPWIFKEINEFLKNGKIIARPPVEKIVQVMLEHLVAVIDFYGERNGVVIFRKFFSWYTRGFRKIRPLRELISRTKTRQEMQEAIQKCVGLQP